MCIVTEGPKVQPILSSSEEGGTLMQHEEVTLRTKAAPQRVVPRRSSMRRRTSSARKSVRFAAASASQDGSFPEDYVVVSRSDAVEVNIPQEGSVSAAHQDTRQPEEPALATVCCLLTPSSEMNHEEKGRVWWQPRDYEVFKGTARLIGMEIRRRAEEAKKGASSSERGGRGAAEGYDSILTRSLDSCDLLVTPPHPSADGEEEETQQQDANPLPKRLFAYLAHWVRVGHSRRGLERWSVAAHADRRNRGREEAVRSVLKEQRRLEEEEKKRRGGAEEEGPAVRRGSREAIAEGIRGASEQATRSARLFALAIAQADAAAIGCGHHAPRASSLPTYVSGTRAPAAAAADPLDGCRTPPEMDSPAKNKMAASAASSPPSPRSVAHKTVVHKPMDGLAVL